MNLDKLLDIVGHRVFVKYYYNFKTFNKDYCISYMEEDYTDKSKISRTLHAKTIINKNLAQEALVKIAKSRRADSETKEAAMQILESEFSCTI